MDFWVAIIMMIVCLFGGFVAYPFVFPYLQKFFGEVLRLETDLERKVKAIRAKVIHQIHIAEEKGEDISEELKDIKQDVDDIWKIIKR